MVKALILEFGHKKIQSIVKDDVQKFIVKTSSRGITTPVIRSHLWVFKGIMEQADDDWNMFQRLKLPKTRRPQQDMYTFEEIRLMLRHAKGVPKILIMLLAETGVRIGEALALQTEDLISNSISISKNMFAGVLQNTPKTDSSIRKISISTRLITELKSLTTSNSKDFLFRTSSGRPIFPQALTYQIKKVCENAGVEYKSPHAFRRGNITALLNDLGMPERIVGMRVGHASQGTTLGIYCQVSTGTDKIWVPRIEEMMYEEV